MKAYMSMCIRCAGHGTLPYIIKYWSVQIRWVALPKQIDLALPKQIDQKSNCLSITTYILYIPSHIQKQMLKHSMYITNIRVLSFESIIPVNCCTSKYVNQYTLLKAPLIWVLCLIFDLFLLAMKRKTNAVITSWVLLPVSNRNTVLRNQIIQMKESNILTLYVCLLQRSRWQKNTQWG